MIPLLFSRPGLVPIVLPLNLVQAIALWWRRRRPSAVLGVIAVLGVAAWLVAPDREPSGLALAFAVYAVSVYDGGRIRLWIAGAAIALVAIAVAMILFGEFQLSRSLVAVGATSLVAWVIGDYIRSRRAFVANLVARNRQEREQAAEEERLRIARELHDVVAHNVSVMAIQAGAARVSGNSSHEALASIEMTARDTLSELNRLVGVLRHGSGSPELSPQPGLAQIDALLRPVRDAGIDATLKISGQPRDLPAALDLSAYRIVQEALTNVLKHSHASRVEVTIDYGLDSVSLVVADNGGGTAEPVAVSTGHGLIGMQERVDLFGGDLSTTSSSLGGFTVRATLPVKT